MTFGDNRKGNLLQIRV